MAPVRLAELERLTTFARAIATPLAEVWSQRGGATVRIESPQAAEVSADDLAATLEGWFWVLPVEVTGIYSGAFGVLVDQSLLVSSRSPGGTDEKSAGRFAAIVDEFLAGAADRLTAAVGSATTLDRLGLREVPGRQAAEILFEFLGRGELVAVSFAAEISARRASDSSRSGGVAVVFGAGLARELAGSRPDGAETVAPAAGAPGAVPAAARMAPLAPPAPSRASADVQGILERAAGLRLRLSVEVGKKTVLLGDMLRMGRGSVIDLDRSITDPFALELAGKRVAVGDIVVLPSGFGLRIRG